MTEIDTTTTDPETGTKNGEGGSDKETNVRKMGEQIEALKAENAELQHLRDKETLREAGFAPETDRGKALAIAIKAGEVKPEKDALVEYAGSYFGWQPETPLTETEASQVEASKDAGKLRQASSSDNPPTPEQAIAEAEADGNFRLARKLKNDQLAAAMIAQGRGG